MNKTEPLISVAMATYNGEEFLDKQLASIINQVYKNIEIVISDDNSTDNTCEIIKQYMQKYKAISVYKNSEENKGFIGNFANALSHCNGQYIVLADQDDIWFENKINTLLENISDKDLIFSDAKLIDAKDNVIADSYSASSGKNVHPSSIIDLIVNNCVTGCTLMITHELLLRSMPFPKNIPAHDQWFAVKAWAGKGLIYYDKALIGYRQHGRNQIGAFRSKNKILERIKVVLKKSKNNDFLRQENKMLNMVKAIRHDDDIFNAINHIEKNNIYRLIGYYDNLIKKKNVLSILITRMRLLKYFTPHGSIKSKIIETLSVLKIML